MFYDNSKSFFSLENPFLWHDCICFWNFNCKTINFTVINLNKTKEPTNNTNKPCLLPTYVPTILAFYLSLSLFLFLFLSLSLLCWAMSVRTFANIYTLRCIHTYTTQPACIFMHLLVSYYWFYFFWKILIRSLRMCYFSVLSSFLVTTLSSR